MLPLPAQLAQAQAAEEKERGNKLFGNKKYKEAIESFTKCIELDPRYDARSKPTRVWGAIQTEDAAVPEELVNVH